METLETDLYFLRITPEKFKEFGINAESPWTTSVLGLYQACLTKEECEKLIPEGFYCYDENGLFPEEVARVEVWW